MLIRTVEEPMTKSRIAADACQSLASAIGREQKGEDDEQGQSDASGQRRFWNRGGRPLDHAKVSKDCFGRATLPPTTVAADEKGGHQIGSIPLLLNAGKRSGHRRCDC